MVVNGPVGMIRTPACFTGIRIFAVRSAGGRTSGWSKDCGAGCTPPPLPEIVRVPRMVPAWKMQWNG